MPKKNFRLDIKGDRKLAKKLNQLSSVVRKPIMRDAAKHAMEPVADLAKRLAPIDTGKTRKYIKAVAFTGRRGVVGARVQTGTRRQMGIEPDDPYYYPAAHEYGTRRMSARSFLRAALFAKKSIAITRLKTFLKRILI